MYIHSKLHRFTVEREPTTFLLSWHMLPKLESCSSPPDIPIVANLLVKVEKGSVMYHQRVTYVCIGCLLCATF
jgi:hypothetical protein